jgi:hypothetical protein
VEFSRVVSRRVIPGTVADCVIVGNPSLALNGPPCDVALANLL